MLSNRRFVFWTLVLATLCLTILCRPTPSRAAGIEWIVIGEPGNPPNNNGAGPVAEVFRISKLEVSNAQYAELLNAVAASDPNGLYNTGMAGSLGGIDRSGSDGSYSYTPKAGFEDRPVNYVGWADAARFANWLHNGEPSGVQDATTTEDGAYTIPVSNETAFRNPGAHYFLSTRNEWIKAGCYDADSNSYWSFPTRTFSAPFCTNPPNPPAGPGVANCNDVVGSLTDGGAYTLSNSEFGTFDQVGNVAEYVEDQGFSATTATALGGSYTQPAGGCLSASGLPQPFEPSYTGLRIASVENPPSVPAFGAMTPLLVGLLLACGTITSSARARPQMESSSSARSRATRSRITSVISRKS